MALSESEIDRCPYCGSLLTRWTTTLTASQDGYVECTPDYPVKIDWNRNTYFYRSNRHCTKMGCLFAEVNDWMSDHTVEASASPRQY